MDLYLNLAALCLVVVLILYIVGIEDEKQRRVVNQMVMLIAGVLALIFAGLSFFL